ncbi:ABC transporter substrate-binding protein [Sanguibacter antarcticus]|uniref:Cellobiose-binding protein n=1 Tax=Sanguibacter antarcticus TaxID=372484 RepID=A0A2A9E1N1_9MICO|nr:extracellular solute-binding protein [Sanguibacter antarcticus]PFG32481.1 cellobiose-binding protein [Sanguibacter antarcticus]
MTRSTRSRRLTTVVAGASIFALSLSACSDSSSDEGGPDADGKITLTVATFNNFGYTDALLAEYTAANPDIIVKQTKAAESGDARTNLTTRLAAGGDGLADVEAIEIDWMPELTPLADRFEDLEAPEVDGRYLDWKLEQGKADNKLIGLGTDIGPEAICYRSDLFAAAGLPTDRDEVAALLGGEDATWEKYFEVGHTFTAASDSAWYDSAVAVMQAQVGQMDAAYEDPSTGEAKSLADNTEIKSAYDAILTESQDLSAHLGMWGDDWKAGFQNDAFATMICPSWMTGSIESESGGVEGWDVADVFPGGGGNWGGSFLTVPSSGKNIEAAKDLALWLTAPEQQVKAFAEAGNFPSQVETLTDESLLSSTNAFFNDAPVGEIFKARAEAVNPVPPFKGGAYFSLVQIVNDAMNRVDVDQTDDAETSWTKALTSYDELGL